MWTESDESLGMTARSLVGCGPEGEEEFTEEEDVGVDRAATKGSLLCSNPDLLEMAPSRFVAVGAAGPAP